MIYLTTENEKCIMKRDIIWENPCDRSEMSMYKKILVAIGVIFLIFFIVKLCEKGPSEPSSFDSIYEESQEEPQEETSTYDNSDSVVTRKREYSFPEYNSDTDEIDDAYEGADYDDYDADWFDDYDDDEGDYDYWRNKQNSTGIFYINFT